MFRQSLTCMRTALGPQRKLFLLVFLWTCLCLVIFRNTLFNVASDERPPHSDKLYARSAGWWPSLTTASTGGGGGGGGSSPAAASSPQQFSLELAPEFALPDNGNTNALYYSLSSSGLAGPWASSVAGRQYVIQNSETSQSWSSDAAAARGYEVRKQQQQHQQAASQSSQHANSSPHTQTASHPQQAPRSKQQAPMTAPRAKRRQHNNEHVVIGSQCKYDYPSLFDLQFNNIHWQKFTTKPLRHNITNDNNNNNSNSTRQTVATFYLYNAYYDDRWRGGLPSVRILAMIDRIQPPPTNCLLWSSGLRSAADDNNRGSSRMVPIVSRATFVYAWYPKWGNYKDGFLQPWIVTCTIPRAHVGLVPDSVSLVEVPAELQDDAERDGPSTSTRLLAGPDSGRAKRDVSSESPQQAAASIAMPPSFSSSSPAVAGASASAGSESSGVGGGTGNNRLNNVSQTTLARGLDVPTKPMRSVQYDCKRTLPITNNLPVYNQRPPVKEKFAVCVKGLDFPHDDISVRLVEWIELLNLLGAGKIFLYNLDVHENISKVLHYYRERGLVELSPLTLPGDQPNLPEYQHLYLKNKLTAKRQNELIPYNDCLYRNLNSYQYLALLDVDEIIMPLKHHNWYDLMHEVETLSLSEQNYSRASYNVRNVYFFDDLAGPLGTPSSSSTLSLQSAAGRGTNIKKLASSTTRAHDNDDDDGADDNDDDNSSQQLDSSTGSHEQGIPHYLHMMQHVYRSKNYTEPGQYVKCFHNTERVVSLHNHFPMNCFGQCTTYSIPVSLAHLQHYRKDCVGPLKQSCKNDFRVFTTRDTTIWKYKQRMIRRTTRVLNHLGLLKQK